MHDLRRWPRKNDAASVAARQDALRPLLDGDGEVFAHDIQPWARAAEMVTGVAVVPVSVVGPLEISLGRYELEEPLGKLVEVDRSPERVYVPLAHTEGGLSASL